jgi:PQQ-dependent dehydrogenase (methanol/ethanol family)
MTRRWQIVLLPALLALVVTGVKAATSSGGFTQAQVTAGANLYAVHCAQCHGASLQGESGPALTGTNFRTSINSVYPTGAALYRFISTQMPLNAPGSLSQPAYLQLTAYILSKNGFPAGNTPLTAANAATLQLAGKRLVTQQQRPQAVEITRAAAPKQKVWAPLPAGANVNITDAMMVNAGSAANDWLLGGKTYANDRYSPLTQITPENVASLMPVAIVQTGITASFETTPVVVNGVMYVTTPVVNNQMKIMALNAATGARYWETTYNLTSFLICCGPVNRGVAAAYGNVYFVTLDDKLVALDARSGRLKWQVTVANATVGYSETMTPLVYNGMVIIGSSGGEWAIRGFVAAYDAQSGHERWRWWSTDPQSYAGTSWQSGGAMVWTTPALDPQRNLLIFSTGNPNPDLYGASRRGDNLWSDSIVALDVRTGKLRWYYQEVKHDVWDYDAVSPVVLFDVVQNGQTIPAAGEAGKVGWFFIVNRDTGKLIRKSDPYVAFSKNAFSQPTKAGVDMLPGANGGAEWSPPAYSPQTHYAYVMGMDQLMKFTTAPQKAVRGQLRLGSAFTNVEPHGVQDGRFVAIDTYTGKIAWTHMTKQPLIGGPLVTASNIAFMGEGDGNFDAFDARTGRLLWQYNLGAGVNAPPVTYMVNGRQYVAVAAGGNFQLDYPLGDAIAIFALPPGPAAPAPVPAASASP